MQELLFKTKAASMNHDNIYIAAEPAVDVDRVTHVRPQCLLSES